VPADRLTPAEHAELGTLPAAVDCSRVRLYRPGLRGAAALARALVLRASRGRAIALGNHVFLPDRSAGDLAALAHELTHCGQYQAWGPARYFARGALAQARDLLHRAFGIGRSPYSYTPEPGKAFERYGIEQQAQIVEDAFRGNLLARRISPFGTGDSDVRSV
jgi:Domain of unknown function (DUF4157)